MDWLLDSPVANLHKFDFLAFYLVVIVATAIACYMLTRRPDLSGKLAPPRVPENPDPYEIAYLRGGVNEVARAVVFNLVQLGHLRLNAADKKHTFRRAGTKTNAKLTPLEQAALNWLAVSASPQELFLADYGLAAKLQPLCASYEDRLQRENLLNTTVAIDAATRIRRLCVCGVMGLGAYKIIVALAQGHSNIGFTVALMLLGGALVWGVGHLPRLSRRGRKYVADLQLAFDRLKYSLPKTPTPINAAGTEAYAANNLPFLLAMGVFGVGALEGTAHEEYKNSFPQSANSSGGGCGSSCGSSCSSGSSCSGGSSCGGGGCGGGCGG